MKIPFITLDFSEFTFYNEVCYVVNFNFFVNKLDFIALSIAGGGLFDPHIHFLKF